MVQGERKKSRKKGAVNLTSGDIHEMVERKRPTLSGTKSVSFSESENQSKKERLRKSQQKKLSSDDDPDAIETLDDYRSNNAKKDSINSSNSSDEDDEESNSDVDQIEKTSATSEEDDDLGSLKTSPIRKARPSAQRRSSNSSHGRPSYVRQQSSKYEGRLREEDNSAQTAFERRLERRKQSQIISEMINGPRADKDKEREISAEASFDFFTKTWPVDEKIVSPQRISHSAQDSGDENDTTEGVPEGDDQDDRKKLFARAIIGDKFDWEITEVVGPEIPKNTGLKRMCFSDPESGLVVPSDKQLAIEVKLPQGEEPRFPEDEGMFIGSRPEVGSKLQNKLEQRILLEQPDSTSKSRWFGQDGRLVALPDPILKNPTRPPVFEDLENQTDLPTYFCSPLPNGQTGIDDFVHGKYTGLSHCQLDIDISSIVFEHHHLFSLEHYLTVTMTEAFAKYHKVKLSQVTKDLDNRLQVLYTAVDSLKEKKDTWRDDEKAFQVRRLETYCLEIQAMREERDADSKQEKTLIRTIWGLWKDLKDLRQKQGFANTTAKIVMRKESCNIEADKIAWKDEIMRQFAEEKEKHELNKVKAMKQFEEELQTWKENHALRREARKRQRVRLKNADSGSGTADATEMAQDEQLLATPEEEKPQPPSDLDEAEVLKKIEKEARESRRVPGDPKIVLEFSSQPSDGDNSSNSVQDNREMSRRQAVNKTKLFVRLFFNGKEVCQSSARSLNKNFVVTFAQIFPIQIVQLPEVLTLQIIEGSTLRTTTLAEVILPLCEEAVGLEKVALIPISFTSTSKFKHDHAGLGAGVDFRSSVDGSSIRNEPIRGKIYARVGWGKSPEGDILAPPREQWRRITQDHSDPLREVISADGRIDPVKLEAWIAKSRIDPNDPDNEELMQRVGEARRKADIGATGSGGTSNVGNGNKSGGAYFRLDHYQDQLVFGNDNDLFQNIRFQMIQLRMNKVDEFKNFRMIPITEKEIPRGILEAREKRVAASRREVVGSGDPLRGRSRLFLEQLRAQVSHRFSLARHRRRHSDIVVEDPIPDFGTLVMMFGEFVPAPRPLRPIRIERKKVSVQDLTGQEIKILLSVVRAYDVPVRSDPDPLVNQSDGPKEALVHSYFEARFQGNTARTTLAEGPNPAWNQQLTLPLKSSNNDFSPDTLNRVKDCIYLHLFDEVTIDLIEDEREDRSSIVHHRIDRRWLGSLTIPFSSLYRNTRIEGTFRLHSPAVLLGYERSGGAIPAGLTGGNMSGSSGSDFPTNSTYVNLYLTVQPALYVPEPVREKLDCDESEELLQHCQRWLKDLTLKYPHRKINPMVADVSGKAVLLTRFFKPLHPPGDLIDLADSNLTAENIAWFVSLIPYTPTNAMFPGLQDIWPTSDQFLRMMTGSECEHALLLTNFFSSLGKKSFLVLGQAVPEGNTAYVLTVEESGEHWLWNPVTGKHMKTTETFCPLESVYGIANESNIWGNLQPSDRPGRLRWDLTNGSDWIPLFGRQLSNPGLPSVQPAQLTYTAPDHRAAKQLKERLERVLRDTLMTLRKKLNQRTTMNFQGNSVLRKLLPGLEASKGNLNGSTGSSGHVTDHLSELQRLTTSHKICGFPLHSAFTDVESITEAVTSTGVHTNRELGVEFALAVFVEPYPSTVMSVWVYVASMVRRR